MNLDLVNLKYIVLLHYHILKIIYNSKKKRKFDKEYSIMNKQT